MYLEASAVAGNFTRAAKSLGLQTSTVSRRVGRIEDELGLTLFERSHAGVHLTSGGKALLPHIRRALAELQAIQQVSEQTGNGQVGELRLALRIPPLGEPLRTLLADWHQQNHKVVLTIFEMNELEVQTALRERRVDVALVIGQLRWPDAAAAHICRERLFVAVPRTHSLARRRRIVWAGVAGETLLVQGWENTLSDRELYATLVGHGVALHTLAASQQSVLALVATGQGIALVTESQTQAVIPGIVYRPVCEDNAWVDIKLLWNPDREDPVTGRFVAFLRDQICSRQFP